MIYKNRRFFNNLSRKIGKSLSRLQLSANQWTLLSLFLVLITFYFLIKRDFIIATVLLAFTASIDMVDGAVARATKTASIFGAYLDTIIDRVIEFIVIIGLLIIGYPDLIVSMNIWLFLLLFSCLMITYAKSAACEKGLVKREMKGGGLLEHPDRMLFFIVIVLLSNFSLLYASFLIAIMTILSIATVVQRFLIATKGKL
jgi:archaetidylinositol phosphate synthase